MVKKMYLLSLFIILLLFGSKVFAQSAGLNLSLAFPMGEFKENVDRLGFGGSINFMFLNAKPKTPFAAGINFGYINYGSESRREPFSSTIPDVTVDVDRTNNLINFHLIFQVIPHAGRFRPYVEGLFGGAYLFTETSIKSRGQTEVASSTNFGDFAWSYGGGAGFIFQVSNKPMGEVSTLFVDLKARYLFGSEAEYLKEGSVKIQNGQVTHDVSRSKTDLLTIHLGIVAFFGF